jgi:phage recombination protein Bet
MTTEIQTTSPRQSLLAKMADRFNVEPNKMLTTLKATAFKGDVSNEQMMALLIVADQYGLNPWTKEIYAFPDRQNGIVPVVGVDGWSRIINSHPAFDGIDFAQDAESCTCIIYRNDRNHPIKVTEYMSECKRDVGPWKSHPRRMLRHKAMIQCARLAFGFVGVYDQDEAERIVERDVTPKPERSQHLADIIGRAKVVADPDDDALRQVETAGTDFSLTGEMTEAEREAIHARELAEAQAANERG